MSSDDAVRRAVGELHDAPVKLECKINRPDLVHCVVRPKFQPRDLPRHGASSEDAADDCANLEYEPDEYQKLARDALWASESVVVSAPTTSGKTTVAIFALEMALQRGGFAAFCAPIKALSNQMFADFHKRFPGKVGLLTGDHSIAPNSPILVMTTEIFRCLLQSDPDFVLKLRAAIFDEVHFLSDLERGPAWEESIVLLPPGVPIVCLSATMSNPINIAGWLSQIKCSTAHAIQKKGRPVPLKHFAYPIGRDPKRLLEVADEKGRVLPFNVDSAKREVDLWHKKWKSIQEKKQARQEQERKEREEKTGRCDEKQKRRNPNKNARWLMEKEYMKSERDLVLALRNEGRKPILVFCFSKAACERFAEYFLEGGVVKDDDTRSARIKAILKEEMKCLPKDVRFTEQLHRGVTENLERGIGVHHGGLVPPLRELTEKLFKEGLLDVLICTETFGMGLNMPAKVVAFHFKTGQPLKKFDGKTQRVLNPTEYMQMSGRAGRRGQDTFGTSILMLNDNFDAQELSSMLGKQNPTVRSHYEMQASSALALRRHGHRYIEWFGLQTLLQFESRDNEPVLQESSNKLEEVMKHPLIGLLKADGAHTQLGRAVSHVACGDILLLARLLSQGCLLGHDPLDVLAFLSVMVLERSLPQDDDSVFLQPPSPALRALVAACAREGAVVDDIILDHKLLRQCDESGSIAERMRERSHLMMPLRCSWLSGATFDETAQQCKKYQLDDGSLVRIIRRMDEAALELIAALKKLRSPEEKDFAERLDEARGAALRRGMPFVESLCRVLRQAPCPLLFVALGAEGQSLQVHLTSSDDPCLSQADSFTTTGNQSLRETRADQVLFLAERTTNQELHQN
eukprot:TRINITY_DN14973_c0_g2_i3.p1 TRINITY_DN14973_c0_g2~~TRINITY_DN14973_c0_g2_i3.p1  ORF type:complete len:857 (+),score=161.49 TRINITY_DN14973_c0_g2_i3:98-2668(+)